MAQQTMQTPTQDAHGEAPDWLPCPPWCVAHSTDAEAMARVAPWSESFTEVHSSAWRVWGGGDQSSEMPAFQFRIVRHDERHFADATVLMGMIDFDVRVDPSDLAVLCDGFLTCDAMRDFGRFLVALADEVDPNGTNGQPVEWKRLDQ